jgi:uncharacterized protein
MKVIVSQISEYDGLTIQHVYAPGELALLGDQAVLKGPSTLNAHLTRKADKVRVTGNVDVSVEINCGRCLAPISINLEQGFDLFYVPPARTGEEKELADDDLAVAFYHDQVIDLDDIVREQVELSLPMSRLCSEACKGLCQQCGANLNEQQCSCSQEETDSRWAALKELKTQNRGSNS